jgi:hypothetical protein
VVVFFMLLATWFTWWQARRRGPQLEQKLPRRAVVAGVVGLAVYIPSLVVAGLIYRALAGSMALALVATFLFNTAIALSLGLLGERITGTATPR